MQASVSGPKAARRESAGAVPGPAAYGKGGTEPTVTDANGRLVPGLEREDFTILDNDKPQPLVVFRGENLPITVVVMLDTSASIDDAKAALQEAMLTTQWPDLPLAAEPQHGYSYDK